MQVKILNNFIIGTNHLGKAVFAARNYKVGDVIVKFEGELFHKSKIPKKLEGEADRYVQVDHDMYLGASGEADDLINHSCEPNAGLRFSTVGILLVAIKEIVIGDEITWDYSTTLYENKWKMLCDCRKVTCRKLVSDFTMLDKELQKKYYDLNIIPKYIRDYMESEQYIVYTKGIESLKNHGSKKYN